MSDFDEDKVQNWEKPERGSVRREEQPYRECPHCGEYKFRTLRSHPRGAKTLDLRNYVYKERCKNCKYEGDKWRDEND